MLLIRIFDTTFRVIFLDLVMLGQIALAALTVSLVLADSYTWKNVHTGGGGGWIGNVVFSPSQKVYITFLNMRWRLFLLLLGRRLSAYRHRRSIQARSRWRLVDPTTRLCGQRSLGLLGRVCTFHSSFIITSDEVLGRASRRTL